MRMVTLLCPEIRLVTLHYVSEMRSVTLHYVSEMRLVTFLFVVSTLFDYGATHLTAGSKRDFTNTRNALKSLESYLSQTVSTLQSQITNINGKIETFEDDFKSRFSLFNFKI